VKLEIVESSDRKPIIVLEPESVFETLWLAEVHFLIKVNSTTHCDSGRRTFGFMKKESEEMTTPPEDRLAEIAEKAYHSKLHSGSVITPEDVEWLISEVERTRAALKKAMGALKYSAELCDKGYSRSENRSHTITISEDDFYSCCGLPRDLNEQALTEIEAILKEEK